MCPSFPIGLYKHHVKIPQLKTELAFSYETHVAYLIIMFLSKYTFNLRLIIISIILPGKGNSEIGRISETVFGFVIFGNGTIVAFFH